MRRRRVVVGASAAATLPAALSAAVLVSAPFAGTTTAPLAATHPVAAGGDAFHAGTATDAAVASLDVSPSMGVTEWLLVAGAEAVVLAGAAAVALVARRDAGTAG